MPNFISKGGKWVGVPTETTSPDKAEVTVAKEQPKAVSTKKPSTSKKSSIFGKQGK